MEAEDKAVHPISWDDEEWSSTAVKMARGDDATSLQQPAVTVGQPEVIATQLSVANLTGERARNTWVRCCDHRSTPDEEHTFDGVACSLRPAGRWVKQVRAFEAFHLAYVDMASPSSRTRA